MKKGKLIGGIVIVILLVVAGFAGKGIYDNYKELKNGSVLLGATNNKLSKQLVILENSRAQAWEAVDSLESRYFLLSEDHINTEEELAVLQDSLSKIPEQIQEIPTEQSYDYLQARIPDEARKPFRFSEIQVKTVHVQLVSYDLLKGINNKLTSSNSILKEQLTTKEEVEAGLRGIIESYKTENMLLLEEMSDLERQNIKVRVQRNAGIIVSAVLAGVLTAIALL